MSKLIVVAKNSCFSIFPQSEVITKASMECSSMVSKAAFDPRDPGSTLAGLLNLERFIHSMHCNTRLLLRQNAKIKAYNRQSLKALSSLLRSSSQLKELLVHINFRKWLSSYCNVIKTLRNHAKPSKPEFHVTSQLLTFR